MRRVSFVVVCCAAFQLLMPAPAQAWWGWLDEMSGPGPWMFVDAKFRIACIKDPAADGIVATRKDPPANVLRTLNSFDGFARFAAAVGGAGCLLQPDVSPRASVNVATGTFVAVANNPRSPGAGRLAMQKYEFSVSTFLDHAKVFEANAGGGVLKGLGDSDFSRGYWTVSATMTPYAAVARDSGKNSALRTITVNVGVVVVPNGFTAKDFGATTSFRSEHEVLKTISLTFDFSRY